jgi:cell fate (sporulation/competence/biofilm development) regulator YmcA (YheA/YmcA/DUF963 family)
VLLSGAGLLSIILVLFASISQKVRSMSASTDSLTAAVTAIAAQVTAVAAKVAELKAGQTNPTDTQAIDKAVADIQSATQALAAAIA